MLKHWVSYPALGVFPSTFSTLHRAGHLAHVRFERSRPLRLYPERFTGIAKALHALFGYAESLAAQADLCCFYWADKHWFRSQGGGNNMASHSDRRDGGDRRRHLLLVRELSFKVTCAASYKHIPLHL